MLGVVVTLVCGSVFAYHEEQNELIVALCAHVEHKAPLTAFLIGGLSRGFSQRYLTLKRTVDDWGSPSEVFLMLKTFDYPPDRAWGTYGQEDAEALSRAVAALQPARVELFSDENPLKAAPFRDWASRCFKGWPHWKVYNSRMVGVHGYWDTMIRLVIAMRAREAERGREFERVFFARPDLEYVATPGPWCGYDNRAFHSRGSDCDVQFPLGAANDNCHKHSGIDFWWLGPREYADVVKKVADRVLNCKVEITNNERGYHTHVWPEATKRHIRIFADQSAFAGLAVVERPSTPLHGAQGIGAMSFFAGRAGISLHKLIYNDTRPDCSVFVTACRERASGCPSHCRLRRSVIQPHNRSETAASRQNATVHDICESQSAKNVCCTHHRRHCPERCEGYANASAAYCGRHSVRI